MAASTVWTVQMRIMSGSSAPRMLERLRDGAKAAASAVEGAEKQVKAFGTTAKTAAPEVRTLSAAIRSINKTFNNFPKDVDQSMDRIQSGFMRTNRAAGGFARTMRVVAMSSAAQFGQVGSALNTVRADANATASAVRSIATAARSIPHNIRINTGVGGAGSGNGGSGNNAGPGMGTLAVAGLGLSAGGALLGGIHGASDLQGATLQAAIATGRMGTNLAGSIGNMRDFRDIAFQMSTMTGQSISDSMGVIASMASAGLSTSQLKAIYKPIAQFTDVLHFGKDKMDYGESAKLGAGLVHDMRLMNAGDTAYGLGRIAQLGYLSPHGTNQLTTQIRRMAPMLENVLPGSVRQRADQITLLAAWADRMGNLPFAGSAISQMTTQMIQPRSKRVLQGLEDLGVYDRKGRNLYFDQKTGTFDVMGALMQVQKHVDEARKSGNAGPAIQALFSGTQNMQRIMMALTSKESLAAYTSLRKQMGDMGSDPVIWMNNVQVQLMGQLSTQTMRLKSDFATLQSVIGDQLLPALTPFVSKLADATEHLSAFLSAHPMAAKVAGVGLAAAGAAGVAASLALGGYVASGILHKIPGVGTVFGRIGHHFNGINVGGRAISAGGRLLDFLSFGGTRRAIGSVAGWIGPRMPQVGGTLLNVFDHLGGAAKLSAGALNIVVRLLGYGIGGLFRLGARAVPVIGEILLLVDTIKFLGAHSHAIGKGIGMAAKWIVAHGVPMLLDAFKSLIGGIVQFIVSTFKGGPGGLVDVLRQGWQGLKAGWNYDQPPTTPSNVVPLRLPPAHGKHVGAATGGFTRGEGLTYLHKNELVVNDRLTRKLDRMTSRHEAGHGGTRTMRIEIASAGGGIPDDPLVLRKLARMIADELSYDAATDSRSGGAIPEMYGHSVYDVTQGVPA